MLTDHERLNTIQAAVQLGVKASKVCRSKDEFEAYNDLKEEIDELKKLGFEPTIVNH